jgi:hypothetical protein
MDNLFLNRANINPDDIVFIYKTGSCAWKSNNTQDEDFVIVVKNGINDHPITDGKGKDLFIRSLDKLKQMAKGETLPYSQFVGLLSVYPENVIYGELPIANYNWFDYQYQALLRDYEYAVKNYFTDKMVNKFTNFNCSKRMCFGLLTYYAIKNGSFNYTAEQRQILQKCHDLELPISYRDELKLNMENLLKEQE